MKTVITYGTYDIFHVGHLNLLERARRLGDRLVVGVSTDEFNALKNKKSFFSYAERSRIITALSCVDHVFPECDWAQKASDIQKFGASIFVMGSDWKGKFDHLSEHCEVTYLDRTEGISTTDIKSALARIDSSTLDQLRVTVDLASQILRGIA